MTTLSYHDLRILLGEQGNNRYRAAKINTSSLSQTLPSTDTLESESARMCRAVEHLSKVEGDAKAMRSLRPRQVKQAVKAVCALLGGLVTLDVQDACEELDKNCVGFDAAKGNEDPAGRLRQEIVDEVRGLALCF